MVIDMDTRMEVRRMVKDGVPKARIARELGLSRNTVKKYLRELGPIKREGCRPRASRLEPVKEYIRQRLALVPLLTTIRLLLEIRKMGYEGGYTVLKDFVKPLRKARELEAILRFETPPGRQAQIDWAHFGYIWIDGKRHKLYLFAMVLGYSRARYVEFTIAIDTETFIQCHLNAFAYLGAYPEELRYDNLKSVVLERVLKTSDSTWNPLFEDFRRHFEFVVRLCRPRRPQTKGKVESTVKFVRSGFFIGRSFSSLQDLNQQAHVWCNEINEHRVHRTTGVLPIVRFEEELPKLTRLDSKPTYVIVLPHERQISLECFVSLFGNLYSAPWEYANREAVVNIAQNRVKIEVSGKLVAEHDLHPGTGAVVKVKQHFAGLYGKVRRLNEEAHQRSLSFYESRLEPPEVERRSLEVYDRLIENDERNEKREVKA